jgi:hypothetical protein
VSKLICKASKAKLMPRLLRRAMCHGAMLNEVALAARRDENTREFD